MSNGIGIREVRAEEYRQVAQMHYRAWRQSYDNIMTPYLLDLFYDPAHWAERVYPEKLTSAGWSMWLAESDREPIGMSIFGPEPDNPDRLEIDALYIATEHQGRGVGSLLLTHALVSQPRADVVLWCAEKNHRARCFYERKGFQPDGRSFSWKPISGLEVPQVGYSLCRSASSR